MMLYVNSCELSQVQTFRVVWSISWQDGSKMLLAQRRKVHLCSKVYIWWRVTSRDVPVDGAYAMPLLLLY